METCGINYIVGRETISNRQDWLSVLYFFPFSMGVKSLIPTLQFFPKARRFEMARQTVERILMECVGKGFSVLSVRQRVITLALPASTSLLLSLREKFHVIKRQC